MASRRQTGGFTAAQPAQPLIKVVAICGSLRQHSCNRGLLRAAMDIAQSIDGLAMEYVDISSLPFLNPDLEVDGLCPPIVEEFKRKLRFADAVLFASPDHNYSITGVLKNAIDWASRPPNVWADKAAAVVSAGTITRGQLSQFHLRQIGVFLDLHFINKPEFHLNVTTFPHVFDTNGNLTNFIVKQELKEVVLSLFRFALQLQGKQLVSP